MSFKQRDIFNCACDWDTSLCMRAKLYLLYVLCQTACILPLSLTTLVCDCVMVACL